MLKFAKIAALCLVAVMAVAGDVTHPQSESPRLVAGLVDRPAVVLSQGHLVCLADRICGHQTLVVQAQAGLVAVCVGVGQGD